MYDPPGFRTFIIEVSNSFASLAGSKEPGDHELDFDFWDFGTSSVPGTSVFFSRSSAPSSAR